MAGLGTIVNVLAIIAGGLLGLAGGKFMTKRFQDIVIMTCGISTVFVGISGAMAKMLVVTENGITTDGSLMMIVSLVIGVVIGELLRIEDRLDGFGEFLKEKSGNSKDGGFVNGFVTASLTVCIGAMAIVGSIEDGIYANHEVLFMKAILDFIIIIVMTSSMGKGCIFSAVSVGILQGVITILSRLIEPLMTEKALTNLSVTGSIMICCVGINLMFGKKIKVGNMLPGLILAVVWAFLPL